MTAVLSIGTFNGNPTLLIVPECSDSSTKTVEIPISFEVAKAITELDWDKE